ncbi:MAG: hypothetical protein K5770_18760 [Lachnospiraceae bacterium]|nr:hypothetical protein [Lachnospiraceae bacterium]
MSPLFSNLIVIAILVFAVTGACLYIYREKKKGRHCIGCPMAGNCHKRAAGCEKSERD